MPAVTPSCGIRRLCSVPGIMEIDRGVSQGLGICSVLATASLGRDQHIEEPLGKDGATARWWPRVPPPAGMCDGEEDPK